MLHSILSKLPKPLDLEGLISHAILRLDTCPPESLSTWNKISSKSVLKTSRKSRFSAGNTTDLILAENLFNSQCRELDWVERRKKIFEAVAKHKGPTTAFTLTILVGLSAVSLSWYMRRSGVSLDLDGVSALMNSFLPLRRMLASIGPSHQN